jgi:hypothetical protein
MLFDDFMTFRERLHCAALDTPPANGHNARG